MSIQAKTLDDVMRIVIEMILSDGAQIGPAKGPAKELIGVSIEITDPRARLSRTETRGRPYSCLGELCWYLAKTNDLEFISYYIPRYKDSADGNAIYGGYGPRLFDWDGLDQVANVTTLLERRADTRRAVIQLFDAHDIVGDRKDVPCTCTLQFMLRSQKLHMLAYMRSNDVVLGLPHDIFSFTMIQEIIARSLAIEVGSYKHIVGSLHLYDNDMEVARQFLEEGWQSTETVMPAMPLGDPWPALALLLEAERMIRTGDFLDEARLDSIDPYWSDLIRLLQVFRYAKEGAADRMVEVRQKFVSSVYLPFVDRRLSLL